MNPFNYRRPKIDMDVEPDGEVEFEVKINKKELREAQKAAEKRRQRIKEKLLNVFWIIILVLQLFMLLVHDRM